MVDEYERPIGTSTVKIHLSTYEVVAHTPKGVQLNVHGTKKFVRLEGVKKFACPTQKEAWNSFIARKKRQQTILQDQLGKTEEVLQLALYKSIKVGMVQENI